MCPRAAQTCEICKKVVSKYRCPSCLVPYCSMGCFKTHKETPCAKPSSTEEKPASPAKEAPVESCSGFVAASPAKEVPVERPVPNDVVGKTQHKGSETPCAKPSLTEEKPASPAKEVPVESCSGFVAASPAKEVPVERPVPNDVVGKTQHKGSAASPEKEIPVARPIHVEDEKYVLEKTQLEAIASSSEIREALKDEALQKLICNIDSSSNPLQELDEAMGVEAFREFRDKILSNISESK